MPLNIRPLSKELQAKAEKELFENPARLEEDVAAFRQWIQKSSYLKCRTDDQHLVTFLRGCKFSLERAKEKFDMFYTMRGNFGEVFRGRYPFTDKTYEIIKLGVVIPLPKAEGPDTPRIILVRPGCYDADDYGLEEVFKVTSLLNDIMMAEDDQLLIAGQINMLDASGLSMGHLKQFNPLFMKKMTMTFQDASPFRIKGLHYVNTPPFFMTVFNLFKTFLNEKLKSRINMYGDDMESLYQKIPRHLLPKEYGGDAGTIDEILEPWVQKIKEYEEFFKLEETLGTDEKKRPGRPRNAEALFGIEGSFRQLELF